MSKRCAVCHRDIDGEKVKEDCLYYEEKKYDTSDMGDIGICRECADKERVKEQAEGFMQSLEGFFRSAGFTNFNSCNLTSKALVQAFTRQHRHIQNELLLFLFRCFESIAALDDGFIDGRNEWGYRWVKAAVKSQETLELAEQISRMSMYGQEEDDVVVATSDAEITLNSLISQARRLLKVE